MGANFELGEMKLPVWARGNPLQTHLLKLVVEAEAVYLRT